MEKYDIESSPVIKEAARWEGLVFDMNQAEGTARTGHTE